MAREIQDRASFDIIRYANCWEDAEILVEGLNIRQGSNCLSIASAGDNSFALLLKNPALVLAVDISLAQIACTEIRKICFLELDYEQVLAFLGYHKAQEDRLFTYHKLKKYLSKNSRAFWDNNPQFISAGLIHHGKFENYFKLFRKYVLPIVQSKKRIRQLLHEKSFAEQDKFYEDHWDTFLWKRMFKIFFSKFIMGKIGRDPEFFKYVKGHAAQRILGRTKFALTKLATHNNPYLNYILTGNFQKALPFYIREENFKIIRENIDNLKIFHGSTDEALKATDSGFDAFNLSDIFEYMDQGLYVQVVENLLKHTNKNARLAYWNMLVHRKISNDFPQRTTHLNEISEQLFKQDKAFFYKSFYVDEVL